MTNIQIYWFTVPIFLKLYLSIRKILFTQHFFSTWTEHKISYLLMILDKIQL